MAGRRAKVAGQNFGAQSAVLFENGSLAFAKVQCSIYYYTKYNSRPMTAFRRNGDDEDATYLPIFRRQTEDGTA